MAQAVISADEWAAQQAIFNDWVKALVEAYFSKVVVIVRPHNMEDSGQPHPYAWSPLAYSAADCVATQWEKTDADGNKTMINENQELLNDWRSQQYLSGDAKAIATFHFFQKAFKILRRFDDSEENQQCAIVGSTKEEIVVAKKYRTVWVVLQAPIVKSSKEAGYTKAPLAYNAACKAIFDAMDEEEM